MKLCSTWREGDEGNLSKKLTPASPHVVKLGSSGTRPMNGTCAGGLLALSAIASHTPSHSKIRATARTPMSLAMASPPPVEKMFVTS